MHKNFVYNNISDALPRLSTAVLRGDEQGSRNGRTREVCHVGITLSRPWQREIVMPERKANIAAQIAETMWVLSGRDDIGWLRQYLPRAADFSDDGERWRGAYGPRLRAWSSEFLGEPKDQWQHVLSTLKADPLSRRTTISIYDPAIDTEPGLDIPCNNWLVFTNRLGHLDLQVGIRSNDLMWGWSGINAFEWSALLEISAALLRVRVGSLHFSIASLHLYEQHWPKAERMATQYGVSDVPTLDDSPRFDAAACERAGGFDALADEWFRVEAMIRERSALAADDAVLDFPEPMLRSWLRVLQWWWSGDHQYLKEIGGTRLEYATHVAMQPPARTDASVSDVSAGESAAQAEAPGPVNPCPVCGGELTHGHHYTGATGHPPVTMAAGATVVVDGPVYEITEEGSALLKRSQFVRTLTALHDQKHEAYGDSWKRRGEMLGILANIARKVDRLGGSETDDETSADTAGDLLVYLAKYQSWLFDQRNGTEWANSTQWANNLLEIVDERTPWPQAIGPDERGLLEARLRERFEMLEGQAVAKDPNRTRLVDAMIVDAYVLARALWEQAEDRKPGGKANPLCLGCGSAESNHRPGGSRSTCVFVARREHDGDDYRGADRD